MPSCQSFPFSFPLLANCGHLFLFSLPLEAIYHHSADTDSADAFVEQA